MIPSANGKSAPARDSLADLVDQLTARLQAGEDIDSAAIVAAHPEYADRLSGLLPALRAVAALGGSGDLSHDGPPMNAELGDFRILRQVGRGGMGVVYEAEQLSLRRRVALKVLPFAATMDPKQLQRFRNEALAAASLRHEHIVPVHAVGCERGVHYYAMQFIDGHTLADVIAEINDAKELNHRGTEDTVKKEKTGPKSSLCSLCLCGNKSGFFRGVAETIAQAAEALEFAHSMGIVHRDVKPGNLMLDGGGKLWVADFGLARFGPDTGLTMSGDLLGTLRYMAPEQALAKHGLADHRVDVYGLGCTLYELLTGRPAVGGEDKAEIVRHIAFEEPIAPRRLDKAIPAELETIALKCLAKTPNERYATAGELAADLRRWVEDKPITAKPPKLWQRSARRLRRHPRVVVAAFAVAVLAAVGAAASAILIDRQKQRAEERFQTARAAVDDMYTRVAEDWLDDAPHLTEVQQAFLKKALEFYQRFGDERGNDPAILHQTAQAWYRVARIQAKLGNQVEAEAACRQAVVRSEALAAAYPVDPRYGAGLALAYQLLNSVLQSPAEFSERERAICRAIEIQKRLVADAPELPGDWPDLAVSYRYLGRMYDEAGRPADSQSPLKEALQIQERLAAAFPEIAVYQSDLGAVLNNLSKSCPEPGEAELLITRAIERQKAALRADPRRVRSRNFMINHLLRRALLMAQASRFDDSQNAFQSAQEYARGLVDDFPAVPEYRLQLVRVFLNQAGLLDKFKRHAEGADAARAARDLARPLVKQFPDLVTYQQVLSTTLVNLFVTSTHVAGLNGADRLDRLREARSAMEERAPILEWLIRESPNDHDLRYHLSAGWYEIARVLADLGEDRPLGRELLHRAIDLDRQVLKAVPGREDYQRLLVSCNTVLNGYVDFEANEHLRAGRIAEAEKLLVERQEQLATMMPDVPSQPEAVRQLAGRFIGLGNFYRTTNQLPKELAAWQAAVKCRPELYEPYKFLGQALIRAGRPDDGLKEMRRAIELNPNYLAGYGDLGSALFGLNRPEDALEVLHRGFELKSDDLTILNNMGSVLNKMGRPGDAEPFLRRAIRLRPEFALAHYNLGNGLMATGRPDEALAELNHAIKLEPENAVFHSIVGLCLRRLGRFPESLTAYRRSDDLVRKQPGGNAASARFVREAEELVAVEAKLMRVLAGDAQPTDAAERIDLAAMCQEHKKLYAAAARFFADAFTADATLAEDPKTPHRYNAACMAALAGCGEGKDAGHLSDSERVRFRQQALDWLTTDLAAWVRRVEAPNARAAIGQKMQVWQKDSDFTGVRDTAALTKLPEPERIAWQKLWADVAELQKRCEESAAASPTKPPKD